MRLLSNECRKLFNRPKNEKTPVRWDRYLEVFKNFKRETRMAKRKSCEKFYEE